MPAGAPRPNPFVKMTDEHRLKIANSNILNVLIEHTEGRREMSQSQVTAGLGLLKKCMPDMTYTEHAGVDGEAIVHEILMRVVDPKG
jgi:hypothetical protein